MSGASDSASSDGKVVIGLSAVVVAIQGDDAVVLTVRPPRRQRRGPALPGPVRSPRATAPSELAMRAFVTEQTRFTLGYVEQLYTFGDKGRDARRSPRHGPPGRRRRRRAAPDYARVISVGYLALAADAEDTHAPGSEWRPWTRFFPYEDWRDGRPAALSLIEDALRRWADGEAQRLGRCAPALRARWRALERGAGAGAL